jgi:predicted alpha/beta hydrolase
MSERATTIPATDGYALSAIVREPEQPRRVVIVSGGTGFPKEFYGRFAAYLEERGNAVVTYDYRGMGGSAPESLRGFTTTMREWGTKDQQGVIDWCARTWPGLPIVLVGHSVGAQLVGMLPRLERVERVVMIAGSTGYWRFHPIPYRWFAFTFWRLHGPLMLALKGYIPAKFLWSGLAVPRGVFLEWRLWCSVPDYLFEIDPSQIPLYERLRVPLRAWCFSDDPIGNTKTVPRLLRRYTNAQVSERWVTPKELGVPRIGHEGFFRAQHRATLWPEVEAWIAGAVP